MNLYLRYFDNETLVSNVEEAIQFLSRIPDIDLTDDLIEDLHEYAANDVFYPKRYKVRQRVYFIVIKTEAATMLDFKQKKALRTAPVANNNETVSPVIAKLTEEKFGWYHCILDFKRVVLIPETGKFEYKDTRFEATCKANSGIDSYNRIVNHLRERVDVRSQFPSAKGKNFHFKFVGYCK